MVRRMTLQESIDMIPNDKFTQEEHDELAVNIYRSSGFVAATLAKEEVFYTNVSCDGYKDIPSAVFAMGELGLLYIDARTQKAYASQEALDKADTKWHAEFRVAEAQRKKEEAEKELKSAELNLSQLEVRGNEVAFAG